MVFFCQNIFEWLVGYIEKSANNHVHHNLLKALQIIRDMVKNRRHRYKIILACRFREKCIYISLDDIKINSHLCGKGALYFFNHCGRNIQGSNLETEGKEF